MAPTHGVFSFPAPTEKSNGSAFGLIRLVLLFMLMEFKPQQRYNKLLRRLISFNSISKTLGNRRSCACILYSSPIGTKTPLLLGIGTQGRGKLHICPWLRLKELKQLPLVGSTNTLTPTWMTLVSPLTTN